MEKINQSYLSDCGLHFFSPGTDAEKIDEATIPSVLSWLPSKVSGTAEAVEYNMQAHQYCEHNKQQFKLTLQELKDVLREIEIQQKLLTTLTPQKSALTKFIAGLGFVLSSPEDQKLAADTYEYIKKLTYKQTDLEDKLAQLRKALPYIHPLWYARTPTQQAEIEQNLPINVSNLLKTIYVAKKFVPRSGKLRTVTWYFGVSHSDVYIAVSDWYDFRIYHSREELADAVRFWKGTDLPLNSIKAEHDGDYKILQDYLMQILSGDSKSKTILRLRDPDQSSKRLLTYYGSELGFIWSERTEGAYNTFTRPRYQICKSSAHFFASISRYLGKWKKYEFCTPQDLEVYSRICPRINIA